jgi:long-chain fatty acid transport protein
MSLGRVPVVLGIGLLTSAGAGVDFRAVPNSNGTSAEYVALDFTGALGVPMTDRFSFGAAFTLGNSFIDGPFTDIGGMVPSYGIRGTVGATYKLYPATRVGAYWQTKKHFKFDDAVLFPQSVPVIGGTTFDLNFDHPENLGLGIADQSLMDGRLLLAMDVLFKQYSNADFLGSIYKNQWVGQFGAQYQLNSRLKLRCGYSYCENPMRDATGVSIGGIDLPDGVPALRYIQGQFAAVAQNFLTGGVGIAEVMPGVDMDMLAGGMFEQSDELDTTIASVESYWVGAYFTWHYGASAKK